MPKVALKTIFYLGLGSGICTLVTDTESCRFDGDVGLDDMSEDAWFGDSKASPPPKAGRDDWFGSRSPQDSSDSWSRSEPDGWFGGDAR